MNLKHLRRTPNEIRKIMYEVALTKLMMGDNVKADVRASKDLNLSRKGALMMSGTMMSLLVEVQYVLRDVPEDYHAHRVRINCIEDDEKRVITWSIPTP
jgi:hypothetical protein